MESSQRSYLVQTLVSDPQLLAEMRVERPEWLTDDLLSEVDTIVANSVEQILANVDMAKVKTTIDRIQAEMFGT